LAILSSFCAFISFLLCLFFFLHSQSAFWEVCRHSAGRRRYSLF
jgi:hypothetical protein